MTSSVGFINLGIPGNLFSVSLQYEDAKLKSSILIDEYPFPRICLFATASNGTSIVREAGFALLSLVHAAIYWTFCSQARDFPLRHHPLCNWHDLGLLFSSGRAFVALDLTCILPLIFTLSARRKRGGGSVIGQLLNQSVHPEPKEFLRVISCLHGISNRNLILSSSVIAGHSTFRLWFPFTGCYFI